MSFIISSCAESHASWPYLMTGTPLLKLRCHERIESLPLLLTHAFNSMKPEYLKARDKYLQLPLLRLKMFGQTEERAQSAVKQHFLPMWVDVPGTDAGSATPFCLEPTNGDCSPESLDSLFPTLLRPSGDLDPDGAQLQGVLIVQVVSTSSSALHHSASAVADGLQLRIACPDQNWLKSLQWQYNKAVGSQQSNGLHDALAAEISSQAGISIPHLQPNMVLWLLNVKELPTSPPGRDGKKLMQRVAVTLPSPPVVRRLGYPLSQAVSCPLAVKASTQGDAWLQQLQQYCPGAVPPPLSSLNVYTPQAAARNINAVSPGAVPAEFVRVPPGAPSGDSSAHQQGGTLSPSAAAGQQGNSPHSASAAAASGAAGGPSELTRLAPVSAVPCLGLPQQAPTLTGPVFHTAEAQPSMPRGQGGGVHGGGALAMSHVSPLQLGIRPLNLHLDEAHIATPAAHLNASTYCSDCTDNPAPVHGGAGGVKRKREGAHASSSSGNHTELCGFFPQGSDASSVGGGLEFYGDSQDALLLGGGLQPSPKSSRSDEPDLFHQLFMPAQSLYDAKEAEVGPVGHPPLDWLNPPPSQGPDGSGNEAHFEGPPPSSQ